MTFYLNVIRYVRQDLNLKKKLIIGLSTIFPFAMIIAVLPVVSRSLVKWSSLKEFIFLFRFEFFFIPIFIIIVGSLFVSNDWIILRRYEKREQIAINKVSMILVISLILTLIYFLSGFIVSMFAKYIIYPNALLSSHAVFQYHPEQTEHSSFISLMFIFFLVISIIGILYMILNDLFNHKVLIAFIIISLIILDKLTVGLIPFCFSHGHQTFPLYTIITLIGIIIILVIIFRGLSSFIDFFSKDEN